MTTKIFAKQVLTDSGWQQNTTVEINKLGKITSISGENVDIANIDNTTEDGVRLTVGVLLPGMPNLHSHSFQRAMAGLAEQRSGNTTDDFWSWRKTMYRFLELLTPEDIESIAAHTQMEMLQAGFTACAEFHYLHHAQNGARYEQTSELSERLFQASLDSGIGYTHLPVLYSRGGFDNQALRDGQLRFGCDLDEFESLFSTLRKSLMELPKDFTLGLAPHSLRAVTKDGLQLVEYLANKHESATPIHIHIAEQVNEVQDAVRHLGARPVQWLLDNANVDSRWCLVHATHMEDIEMRSLAHSKAIAGLCPITEANLGDGIFKATQFVAEGGRWGIGSDSNIRISLSEELRLLEVSQRLSLRCRVALTDADYPSNGRYLYNKAADGGAQALGRKCGEIKIGNYADLIALDDQHHTISDLKNDSILDAWIFAGNDDIVSNVWSAGRHVIRDGLHINHQKISTRFQNTMRRLRQAL